jgi:hypothetical protein
MILFVRPSTFCVLLKWFYKTAVLELNKLQTGSVGILYIRSTLWATRFPMLFIRNEVLSAFYENDSCFKENRE